MSSEIGKNFKNKIGEKTGQYLIEIKADHLNEFARSIGMTGPIDEAPPTYMTSFRDREFELFYRVGLKLNDILHAEQEYEYGKPIVPGMTLRCETEFCETYDKGNASVRLYFLIFKTFCHDHATGEFIGRSVTNVIYREQVGS